MRTIRMISITLLLLVAVNAMVAGYLFVKDPSGAALGISTDWLYYSPFSNFLIPGITLFIVNGIFTLVAATFSIFKWKYYPGLITFQGLLLVGWIILQVMFMRDVYFLHYILGAIGILLFTFGNRLNV